ncbi:hypothetical protein J6590_100639 [Homalodisca vitripennis]|nr:hypothetical protein J6590_100639 [Homalodisca vitripennis]
MTSSTERKALEVSICESLTLARGQFWNFWKNFRTAFFHTTAGLCSFCCGYSTQYSLVSWCGGGPPSSSDSWATASHLPLLCVGDITEGLCVMTTSACVPDVFLAVPPAQTPLPARASLSSSAVLAATDSAFSVLAFPAPAHPLLEPSPCPFSSTGFSSCFMKLL